MFIYIDYNPNKLHALVASQIAVSGDLLLEDADVSNLYLYHDVDITTIKHQPTDSSQQESLAGYYCQLIKSIYITNQGGEI